MLFRSKDSYYVQFPVVDDGAKLKLGIGVPGARLRRWKVGCLNKAVAKEQEGVIKTQLMAGITLAPEPVVRAVTLREYAEKWLSTARSSLAVKTQTGYRQILKLYVLPALGDRSLKSLTWANVKSLLNDKQREGLSVHTVRLIRAVISSILTDAAEDNVIAGNPLIGQRRKRRASLTLSPEVTPLDWEQKQILETTLIELEEGGSLAPSYSALFRLSLLTGLRPGEARALKPGDIDFHGKRLRVERAATLGGGIKNTKTGESRWVDLSDGLLAHLQRYGTLLKAEGVVSGNESAWLFPSLTGTVLDESHVVRAFHRVLDRAGLDRKSTRLNSSHVSESRMPSSA